MKTRMKLGKPVHLEMLFKETRGQESHPWMKAGVIYSITTNAIVNYLLLSSTSKFQSSNKRRGKNGALDTGSRRRGEVPPKLSMDDIFMKGNGDDIRNICNSLDKYDDGDSACRTAEGFLVKLPDDENDQIRMYEWCVEMGFHPADSSLPVMKLPAAKVEVLCQEYMRMSINFSPVGLLFEAIHK